MALRAPRRRGAGGLAARRRASGRARGRGPRRSASGREDQQLIFEEFRQVDGEHHPQHGRHRPRSRAGQAVRRDARRRDRRSSRSSGEGSVFRVLPAARRVRALSRRDARRSALVRLPGRRAAGDAERRRTTRPLVLVAEDDDDLLARASPPTSRRPATGCCGRATATRRWRSPAPSGRRRSPSTSCCPVRDGWEVLQAAQVRSRDARASR